MNRRVALTVGGILATAIGVVLIARVDMSRPKRLDPVGRTPESTPSGARDGESGVTGVPSPATPVVDGVPPTTPAQVPEQGTVSGRIHAEDGTPIPGVWLTLDGTNQRVVTEDDGTYQFRGIAPDAIATVRCESAEESRSGRCGATGLDFVLPMYVVRVRLLAPEGASVTKARLSYSLHRNGDEIGGGTLAVPPAGVPVAVEKGVTLRVEVNLPGFREATHELAFDGAPGARALDLPLAALEEPGGLQILASTESGNPLRSVFVDLTTKSGERLGAFSNVQIDLDTDGMGLLEGVPAGECGVRLSTTISPAHLSRFEYAIDAKVVVLPARVARVEAKFREGGWVRVRCVRSDGTVLVPSWIELLSDAVPVPRVQFLGELGGDWVYPSPTVAPVVSQCPLAPGEYGLRYRPANRTNGEWTLAPTTVVVRPREVTEVDLVVER